MGKSTHFPLDRKQFQAEQTVRPLKTTAIQQSNKKDAQDDSEGETFEDQLTIDFELHLADIRAIVDKNDILRNNSSVDTGKAISKGMLTALATENLAHLAKTPRFLLIYIEPIVHKKLACNYFS